MTFDEICAVLVKEPYNFTFQQIARLTDYQICEILFRSGRHKSSGMSFAECAQLARQEAGLPPLEFADDSTRPEQA